MGKSRQAEHAALIDWLLEQVDAQAVDAVLIAGDIFDTGAPPSYARELYSQLVVRLHAAGVALLLLGGNHDSVATLAESRALLACLDTTVVAAVGEAADGDRTAAAHALLDASRAGLLVRAAWPRGPGEPGRPEYRYVLTDKGRERLAWYRAGGELPADLAAGLEPTEVEKRRRRARRRQLYRYHLEAEVVLD